MTQPLDLAPFWPRLLLGGFAGILTWAVALGYGLWIVDRFAPMEDKAARFGVAGALGYTLVGSAVGVLGLFHAIHPLALEALLALALIGAVYVVKRVLKPNATAPVLKRNVAARVYPRPGRGDSPGLPEIVADGAAYVVIAAAWVTALVAAALPAVWWDPIAYHLPLVAAALAHGAFTFTPAMVQSGFPSLGEAAALPAYAIAGSAGAAMVTRFAGGCLALLAAALATRIVAGSGTVAAMLAVSSPLWLWLAPTFYVDVPFAMLVLAGVVVVLGRSKDRPLHGETLLKAASQGNVAAVVPYVLAGWLCGAAAAVKYSGLGACAIVLAGVLVLSGLQRWRAGGAFVIGALAVAAGWYLRTFFATGDPLYPFLTAHLSHAAAVEQFALRYVDMTRNWCGGGNSLGDLVRLPFRLLVNPRDFCGDPGVALRAGIVFAIASSAVLRSALPVTLLTIALTTAWFFSSQQWRFALAPMTTYATLVASGTSVLGSRLRSVYVLALCLLGAVLVALNWLPFARSQAAQSIVPAFAYIGGRQSAAQYLDDRLETFAAALWLAREVRPGERVLALDDVRDYYFPAGTVWGNPYYQQALSLDWLAAADARYAPLRALGIRYIVVNENEAYVHRTPTGVAWAVLASDARSVLHQVFSQNDTIVYEIKPR